MLVSSCQSGRNLRRFEDRYVKSEILIDDLNFDAGNERKYTKKKHNEFSNITQRERCEKHSCIAWQNL